MLRIEIAPGSLYFCTMGDDTYPPMLQLGRLWFIWDRESPTPPASGPQ